MLKNFRIGKRLTISFIIIALLASVSGLVGLAVSIKLNADYSQALVENGFVQGDLGKFNTSLNKGSALIRDMIFLTDQDELDRTEQELQVALNNVNQALADFRVNCQTQAELDQIAIIDKNLPLYQEKRQVVIDLGLQNQNDEALAVFQNEARPYLLECENAISTLIELNTTMGYDVSASLSTQAVIFSILIVAVVIVAFIISLFLGRSIALSISNPIEQCSERLGLLADGDLHSPVPESDAQDEVGDMLRAMKITTENIESINQDIDESLAQIADGNLDVSTKVDYKGDFVSIKNSIEKIIGALNETFYEINVTAGQVNSGADQVAQSATSLAQASTDQASSIEELSATMNEISDQVKSTAENADEANHKSQMSNSEVTGCNQQMQQMIDAMTDIQKISVDISGIISNIEDIATQTNLLSLNAAIEAARAGDAGRGFAVVAEQVRKLASESADAVQTTAELIERNMQAVQTGIQIADTTATSMNNVVESTNSVTSLIADISTAADTQAESIEQIMQAINQISDIIQSNSATSQESSAASEELLAQAQVMKELIDRFRLKNME